LEEAAEEVAVMAKVAVAEAVVVEEEEEVIRERRMNGFPSPSWVVW